MCGFPPSSFGNGGPAVCGIVVRGGRGGNGPGTREPQTLDLVGRNAGRIPGWSGLPGFRVRRLGILAAGRGRREAKERVLRQRKRSVEARRAPRAAVSPCHSVTRADLAPAGEASLTASPLRLFPRGLRSSAAATQRTGCEAGEGLPCPCSRNSTSWCFYTLPRGCSSAGGSATRRITLPEAARPEFAAPMTSAPAANGRVRGCRGLQAAQWPRAGTYVLN